METRTDLAKRFLTCGAPKRIIIKNLIERGFQFVRDLGLFREPEYNGYGEYKDDFETNLGWLLETPLQQLSGDDWYEVQGQADFHFTL